MVRIAVSVALLLTLACAAPTALRAPGSFVAVGADLDEVWASTLTALRQRGWPPSDLRPGRNAGVVITDWFHVGRRGSEYMDCGEEEPLRPHRGRIEVEMRRRPEGVAVEIRPRWRGRTRDGERDSCLTRGVAEDELRLAILALVDARR